MKEKGLVLDNQQIFDAFNGAEMAIYSHLANANSWWATRGLGVRILNLQNKWKAYVRVALSSLGQVSYIDRCLLAVLIS